MYPPPTGTAEQVNSRMGRFGPTAVALVREHGAYLGLEGGDARL
jgi:hypothetical protein